MINQTSKDYIKEIVESKFEELDAILSGNPSEIMYDFEKEIDKIVIEIIDQFNLRGYTEIKNEITIEILKAFINEKG